MRNENKTNELIKTAERLRTKVRWAFGIFLLLGLFQIWFAIDNPLVRTVDAANGKNHTSRAEIMTELRGWCDTIVHVQSICWDGAEKIYQKKNYTGVVFSADSTGTYLLTSDEGLEFTNEELEKLRRKYDLDANDKLQTKIEVVWNGDLRTEAAILGESVQRNVAILKLTQNVSFDHVPVFSTTSVSGKDIVWLLKYPQDLNPVGHISSDDVTISMAKVTKCYELYETEYFNLDISIDDESTGGPVFNEGGDIVGFFIKTGGEYRTITSQELRHLLDSYNVYYLKNAEVVKQIITSKHIVLAVILLLLIALYIKNILSEKPQNGNSPKKHSKVSKSSGLNTGGSLGASIEYPAENKVSTINGMRYVIGRSDAVEFSIPDQRSVSRRHAVISFDGKDYYLEDLNSTNGTMVNGNKLYPGNRVKLTGGDVLEVGDVRLVFNQ